MSTRDPAMPEAHGLGTLPGDVAEVALGEEVVLPLIEETARIDKRAVETGRVRVSTHTETIDQVLRETLRSDMVGVTRVPLNRTLAEGEAVPQIRTENGVTIIPVLEEILVVEKRLVLKEEVHVRQTTSGEDVEVPVMLRRQHAVVERIGPGRPTERSLAHHHGDEAMSQTITALYDDQAQAQTAMSKLVAAGFSQSSIRLTPGSSTTTTRSSTGSYDHTRDEGGFWAGLKDLFMPEEDRYAYTEGLSRGGTLLTATVEDSRVPAAMDILEENGSVDLDEREASWRKEGWSGYEGATGSSAVGAVGSTAGATAARAEGATEAVAAHGAAQTGTDYIPVVEERLNVGKRMVDSGRVRVRSYAVEEAVSENVTLHDETVQVDRRVVDRAVAPGDEALFADKVIEATETREQAVVSKDARVVGEVGIRKDATQRTETISDTVRRTEVEVEDGRGTVSRTDTSGTTTEKTPRKPV